MLKIKAIVVVIVIANKEIIGDTVVVKMLTMIKIYTIIISEKIMIKG